MLAFVEDSTCDLDMVSLFPEDTFKGRENGLRKDIAEALGAKPLPALPGGFNPHKGEGYDDDGSSAQKYGSDLVDEHYYSSPEWFLANIHHYEDYDEKGDRLQWEFGGWDNWDCNLTTIYNGRDPTIINRILTEILQEGDRKTKVYITSLHDYALTAENTFEQPQNIVPKESTETL